MIRAYTVYAGAPIQRIICNILLVLHTMCCMACARLIGKKGAIERRALPKRRHR